MLWTISITLVFNIFMPTSGTNERLIHLLLSTSCQVCYICDLSETLWSKVAQDPETSLYAASADQSLAGSKGRAKNDE
jgi:hypothetical protein